MYKSKRDPSGKLWTLNDNAVSAMIRNVPSGGDVDSAGGYAGARAGLCGKSLCLAPNLAVSLKLL